MKPILAITIAAAALGAHPASAQFSDGVPMPEVTWDVELGREVPLERSFTDHTGERVRLGELITGDKPVVLALVYYECPMLCNLVMGGLVRALKALPLTVGEDFDVISISIDPEETPELAAGKRAGYVERYDRGDDGEGWHFLVGEGAEIEAVAEAVGFGYTFVPGTGEYAHAAGITLLSPAGRVSHVLFGTEFSARDLRLALVESSAGRLGTTVDKILLRCFQYDPAKGQYGLAILTVIRLGGGLTVLLLGGFIGLSLRRDRSRLVTSP
ncbi:MAG: SCO family protein [Planctomycetota bacterium]